METKGVDFEGMKADISNAPDGSIIVLHACAHNPTGADLSFAQWEELSTVMLAKSHLPFFDCAYQGFASGVREILKLIRIEQALWVGNEKAQSFYPEVAKTASPSPPFFFFWVFGSCFLSRGRRMNRIC